MSPAHSASHTIALSPTGDGPIGIPTGKPFSGILGSNRPVSEEGLTVAAQTEVRP